MLASTLKLEELLSTDIQTLMNRLFWEETIRVFEPAHPRNSTAAARAKKLATCSRCWASEEVDDAPSMNWASWRIDCDFCGKHYSFDKVDCAQLFVDGRRRSQVLLPASDVKH